MRVLLLLSAFTFVGCVTPRPGASAGDGTAEASSGDQTSEGDTLICRRERVTGSNMIKKVCHYEKDEAEKEKADRELREGTQDAMRRPTQGITSGGEGGP